MRRLLWVPLVAGLAACPPPIDTGADGGGPIVVGPEGGIFFREGAVLEIPKNAVGSDTTITLTLIDTDCTAQISTLSCVPPVPDRARLSVGYRFSPITLVFKEPVKITLPYFEDRLPAPGIDKATFDLRRGDGEDPYLELPSPTTLDDLPAVSATTEKLGLFWITSPDKPAVSELTLTPAEAQLMVGQTQQFTAEVTDPAGNPLPDVEVVWTLVPPRVATVSADGLVEALAPGTATLTARAADAERVATVYVVGDTVGPSTFIHENPLPTGNDLYGGAAFAGHAFFVGDNATVLQRSPQGAWTRLFSGPGLTLRDAAGQLPDAAVAVGQTGQQGILIDVSAGTQPQLKAFQTALPRSVWFDGTYGMAVGTGNDVIVRRDGEWVTEYSPSFEALLDVVGDGAGGFTTVGDRGSIYQFDPASQTWDSLFNSQLGVLFAGAVIADPAGTDAWGVGANKLWHFQQDAWSAVNLPASPAVTDLTAVGLVDGKVVVAARAGPSGHLLIFTPDATGLDGTWTTVALRGPQVVRGIFGDGAQGYAVGDFGAVWEYGSGTFTEVSSGFYGDVADVYAAQGIVVAAVNECQDLACQTRVGTVVSRQQNGAWQPLGFQGFSGPLFAVAARSATEVYAAGEGSIWRYDGFSWTPTFLTNLPIRDLAICGAFVWAVGDAGTVFSGTGTPAFLGQLGTDDLFAVDCRDQTEVWMAGNEALFRDQSGTQAFIKDPKYNHGNWRALWTPARNEVYAFGDASFGAYWNGANMRLYQQPGGMLPEVVTGLWGSSVDNLYGVAWTVTPFTFGYALRFNGAQWSLVDLGAARRPSSIHGRSETEIYVGTEGGGLLRAVPPE